MTPPAQTPYAAFHAMLERVIGQPLAAAGFALEPNATHHMRGLFRYQKRLSDHVQISLAFQLLPYADGSGRFQVLLRRRTPETAYFEVSLPRLLWDTFDVAQLGSPEHWWHFRTPQELVQALFEAGKLLFAFGVPYLEGRLMP
jgi:SAM-dependent methyltransferase